MQLLRYSCTYHGMSRNVTNVEPSYRQVFIEILSILYYFQIGLFNFRPSVRPVPLQVHINGFPGKHYCPRMATMNKPTFAAIRTHSPDKPTLIFVSSRRQTRLTALDLIAYLAADSNAKQWLHMPEEEVGNLVDVKLFSLMNILSENFNLV